MKTFFSIQESADYLGVEYKTIWRAIRKGDLPAAKIGGVYRIRKEDIDALFGKQALGPSAAEREVSAMNVCAYCGRDISSDLDVGGRCEVCGSKLCTSCWFLEGRHHCQEHTPVAAAELVTVAAESAVPVRCARCLRVLPEGAAAGVCQSPVCDQPLCGECWSRFSDRFCRAHVPGKEQRLAKARRDLVAGIIPCLVPSIEAKKAEISFIGRFDQKVRGINTIRNPLDGSLYRMLSWDGAHEAGDDVVRLLDILKTGFLDKAVADVLPMNLWSRYTAPNLRASRGQGLTVETRCISHLEAHASDNFDTARITLSELLPMLAAHAKQAEENRRPHILGLGSSTGWDAEAVEYVGADASGRSYSHRFLLPCLIDLLSGKIVYDRFDERILSFIPLFSFTLEGEDIQRVLSYIRDYLMTHDGLPVNEIAGAVGVSAETAKKAIDRLVEAGSHRVEQIKGIGTVIMRRSD